MRGARYREPLAALATSTGPRRRLLHQLVEVDVEGLGEAPQRDRHPGLLAPTMGATTSGK